MEIIDNFLNHIEFEQIQYTMLNWNFPWYLNSADSLENSIKKGTYYGEGINSGINFSHKFHTKEEGPEQYYSIVEPIVKQLERQCGLVELSDIRARLITKTDEIYQYQWHTDKPYYIPGAKTAVLYLNDNNGYTIFEDGKKSETKANRLVMFDVNKMHAGTTSTDSKYRALINFNFLSNR